MERERVKPCPCCGEISLGEDDLFDICPICGWENDDLQRDEPDFEGGANDMSLNQAKEAWRKRQ